MFSCEEPLVELAQVARGWNLSTSEDRDTLWNLYEKHLVTTLYKGGVGHPCSVTAVVLGVQLDYVLYL